MLSFLDKISGGLIGRLAGQSRAKSLAVVFGEGRVDLVSIERRTDALPRVVVAESLGRNGNDAKTLCAIRKTMGLDTYRCTTVMPGGQYQLLQTDAPEASIPVGEAREMLRWKVKDMVDFPVDNAAVDYLPIPEGRAPQVFVGVCAEGPVTAVVQNFQMAKMRLEVIDLPEFSQRNLAALFEDKDRGLATLIFDDREGMLTITYRGELLVVRHIDIASAQLASPDADRRADLYERIGLDVQRSLDNFDRTFSHVSLSKVMVAEVPGAEGFINYMKSNLALSVEAMDLASRLDLSEVPALLDPIRQAQSLRALGTALGASKVRVGADASPNAGHATKATEMVGGGVGQINLWHARYLKKLELLTLTNVATSSLAASILVAIASAWAASAATSGQSEATAANARYKALKEQFESATKAAGARKPNAKLESEIAAAELLLQRRDDVAKLLEGGAIGNTTGFAEYLRGLARQIPDGIWLTGFSIEAGGQEMEIRGRMLNASALPDYIRRLGGEPAFRGRSFAALTLERPGEGASVKGGQGVPALAAASATQNATATSPRYLDFLLTPRLADAKGDKADKGGRS